MIFTGLVLLLLVPESPYFLIMKQKHNEARKVVQILNCDVDNKEVDNMLRDIEQFVQQDIHLKANTQFDATDKTERAIILSPEECSVPYEQRENPTILNTTTKCNAKRISISGEETFLRKSEDYIGRSQHFKAVPIKLILVIAGLFLFTRFCGT